jgi:hypothetical protein
LQFKFEASVTIGAAVRVRRTNFGKIDLGLEKKALFPLQSDEKNVLCLFHLCDEGKDRCLLFGACSCIRSYFQDFFLGRISIACISMNFKGTCE